MVIIAILFIVLMASITIYSLCRITSKSCGDVRSKSLVFADRTVAMRVEDLLSDGDAESIHRILKALQQRREIDITESENEILISEHCRDTFHDLIASGQDPLEYLRHLDVMSLLNPDFHPVGVDKGITVSGHEPVAIHDFATVTDDLFASEYDIGELLGNLSLKPGKESGSGLAFQPTALNCA